MDVRAILLVGTTDTPPQATAPEAIAGVPLAYLDVLGMCVLERILQRLHHFGVSAITLISDAPAHAQPYVRRATLRPDLPLIEASGPEFWRAAENAFDSYVEAGAELVIVLRIGAYAEIDFEEMIQHHLDKRCRVSIAVDPSDTSLDVFVLNARPRGDAATLFRSRLKRVRKDCQRFAVNGYINRLQGAGDLRRMALDGLLEKNAVRPVGEQVRPGIWYGDGARVHPKARIVAPAFIGAHSRVRASALVTRSTVLEHHAEVDCGTVVENSTLLPFTYVGAGLDVMHAVVGFRRIAHLVRNVEVEVSDAKLVGMSAITPLSRVAGSTAALFAFLPKQIYRGFFGPRPKPSPELPEALARPAAALEEPGREASSSDGEATDFPSSFAVVRKYGDH